MRSIFRFSISAVLFVAASALYAGETCHFDIPYNVRITPQQTIFEAHSASTGAKQIIVSAAGVEVDGQRLEVNDEQRKTAALFHQEARGFVPQITQVVIEAVDIALLSVTLVADAFFDGDAATRDELIRPLEQASLKVKSQLAPDHFDEARFEQVMEKEFEPAIEKVVDTAVSRYSGKAFSRLIGAIFSGDNEEAEDLAFRMENMGAEIEKKVEAKAEALAQMTSQLCQSLQRMDELEHNLLGIPGYPADGVIKPSHEGVIQRLPGKSISL